MFFELLNPVQKLGRLRLQAVLRLLDDNVGQATPVSPGGASAPFLVSRPTFAAAPRLVDLTSSPGITRVCISWLTALYFGLTKLFSFVGSKSTGKYCAPVMAAPASLGQRPTGFKTAPPVGGPTLFSHTHCWHDKQHTPNGFCLRRYAAAAYLAKIGD